jgi:hypothetical protein
VSNLPLGVGCFIVGPFGGRWADAGARRWNASAAGRMVPGLLAALFVFPVATLTYGWALDRSTHLAVPLIASFFMGASICTFFPGVMSYVSILKQHAAAAAGGAVQAMMFITGGVVRAGGGGRRGACVCGGGYPAAGQSPPAAAPSPTHRRARPPALTHPRIPSSHPHPLHPPPPQFIQITPPAIAAIGLGWWMTVMVGVCVFVCLVSAVLTNRALKAGAAARESLPVSTDGGDASVEPSAKSAPPAPLPVTADARSKAAAAAEEADDVAAGRRP